MKKDMNNIPLDKIVFSYKEFGYNRCDVCITPHTLVNWSNGNMFFKIETAQSPNEKWDSALYCQIGERGGGRKCFLLTKPDEGYTSEKEAIYDELIYLEELINKELKGSVIAQQFQNKEDEYPLSKNMNRNLRLALKQTAFFKAQFNPRELNLFD